MIPYLPGLVNTGRGQKRRKRLQKSPGFPLEAAGSSAQALVCWRPDGCTPRLRIVSGTAGARGRQMRSGCGAFHDTGIRRFRPADLPPFSAGAEHPSDRKCNALQMEEGTENVAFFMLGRIAKSTKTVYQTVKKAANKSAGCNEGSQPFIFKAAGGRHIAGERQNAASSILVLSVK